MTMRN